LDDTPAKQLIRRDRAVRSILTAWRELTGGGRDASSPRRTLIACSGGADSSALAIALASSARELVLGHVVHDMRPVAEAEEDLSRVRRLADALGLEIAEDGVRPGEAGSNVESVARDMRYEALARMAAAHHCPWIATGHHADDQLETVLMRLSRGAGLSGLRGVARRRRCGEATVIRPMLGIVRVDAERICEIARWRWSEDRTNRDLGRLRARIRHGVVPALRDAADSGVALRVSRVCEHARGARRVVARAAASLESLEDRDDGALLGVRWGREELREQDAIVIGWALRDAARRLRGRSGEDSLGSRALSPVVRAIRERSGEVREFAWRGLRVTVDPDGVCLRLEDVA